jgi:tetratricopeptide (TPR) repeat protein
VEFCHIRAVKSAAAIAAFAFALTGLSTSLSFAQTAAQQPAGAPTATKNWKDRAEYDLYASIVKAKDPKERLTLLNQWADKYPTSDYKPDRAALFCTTYNQIASGDPANAAADAQKVMQYCKQAVDLDPKYFQGYYFPLVWGPIAGGSSPNPEIQSQVDADAHALIDQGIKPPGVPDDKWAAAKPQVLALAHKALAWEDTSKKDTAGAEEQYKDVLEANPNDSGVAYQYGTLLQNDKKYADALFEYARAATYDGPGSLPADKRQQVLDYFNKVYKDYHGSADGADKFLTAAKTSAVPPPGFQPPPSASQTAQEEADNLQKRMDSHPDFKLWETIKTNLTAADGQTFFSNTVKGAEIPGTAVPGVTSFTGTVISVEPPDKPTTITLGVEDKNTPDATLTFSEPINPVTPIKTGDQLAFSGVADSYAATPYMLTFKDPSLPDTKLATERKRTVHGRKKR